jgi:hypothetical protein
MKKLITVVIVTFILLGMVACASPAPYTESANDRYGEGVVVKESASPPGIAIPEPAPAPTPTPSPTPSPTLVPAPVEEELGESWATERMIVRTGNMSLVVADVAKAMEEITKLADSLEGYVVSSNSWREGDRLVGAIAIRVAAEQFDYAVGALRQMAVEVNSESTTSKDVTEEYVDLSARLHTLEASETQLLELMKQAGKVEDILEVQRELTTTRSEIEQTKGRMQYLEQTSATSLIEVQLQQQELDVRFTASKRTLKVGEETRFDPTIGGGFTPYSYEWDFGDGSSSTDERPIHAYKSEGSYTVVLKVTDDRGNTADEKKDNYIDVLPGWSAGSTASSAWNGFLAFGRVVIDILIWIVYFIPLWIVIGVILYFAWWRRRKKA